MQNLNIKYVAHFQKTARDSGTASSLVETKISEETERRRNKKLKKQPTLKMSYTWITDVRGSSLQ